MKKPAAKSMRFCDRRAADARTRSRRLWRADMMSALRTIMEGEGVENQWARERVQKLFTRAQPHKAEPEMAVNLGGVRVTVSGPGVALVLAPGLKPQREDDDVGDDE